MNIVGVAGSFGLTIIALPTRAERLDEQRLRRGLLEVLHQRVVLLREVEQHAVLRRRLRDRVRRVDHELARELGGARLHDRFGRACPSARGRRPRPMPRLPRTCRSPRRLSRPASTRRASRARASRASPRGRARETHWRAYRRPHPNRGSLLSCGYANASPGGGLQVERPGSDRRTVVASDPRRVPRAAVALATGSSNISSDGTSSTRPSPRNRIAAAENGPMPGIASSASRARRTARRRGSPRRSRGPRGRPSRSARPWRDGRSHLRSRRRRDEPASASSGIARSVRPPCSTAKPNRARNRCLYAAATLIGVRCIITQYTAISSSPRNRT